MAFSAKGLASRKLQAAQRPGISTPLPARLAQVSRGACVNLRTKASPAPATVSTEEMLDKAADAKMGIAAPETTVASVEDPTLVEKAEKAAPPAPVDFSRAVMMQGFGWGSCNVKKGWYKVLEENVQVMKDLGVTHLWLPPPSQSVAPQGYLPGQLYNLNSKYGNQKQLVSLIKTIKAAGIVPMCDIVINHRCADEQVDGKWNKFRDDVPHKGTRLDWDKSHIASGDEFGGEGAGDTGDSYDPAPDIDHTNPQVQAGLKDWLSFMAKDIGFGGWRFDYVKGFAAEYIAMYIDASVGGSVLNVGEYWVDLRWTDGQLDYNQDSPRQILVDWLDANGARCCVFDFPLKGILQEAVKNCQYNRLRDSQGRSSGVLGIWPSKAVTFVENHDTGSTQQHWPFPAHRMQLGYAYILTHPGMPCIFWEDFFDKGEENKTKLRELVALRKRADLHSRSKLEILRADHDQYVAKIDNKVIVKLGPKHDMGDLTPREDQGWKVVTFGDDYCVWEKTA